MILAILVIIHIDPRRRRVRQVRRALNGIRGRSIPLVSPGNAQVQLLRLHFIDVCIAASRGYRIFTISSLNIKLSLLDQILRSMSLFFLCSARFMLIFRLLKDRWSSIWNARCLNQSLIGQIDLTIEEMMVALITRIRSLHPQKRVRWGLQQNIPFMLRRMNLLLLERVLPCQERILIITSIRIHH